MDILNEPIERVKPSHAVRIAMLVDETGSMIRDAKQTVDSLNSYLDEQATKNETILISLYTFNTNGIRNRFRAVNAKNTPRLHRNNDLLENQVLDHNLLYAPAAGTPLHDAIATVISQEQSDDVPTLIVVVTDGEENESKEFRTLESIQALIKEKEDSGWTFVFLMAGLSRQQSELYTTRLMGRNYSGATMTYAKGTEDIAFKGLAASTRSWTESSIGSNTIRTSAKTADFFAPSDRDIQKK